jgi:hypothetical protein
VKVSELSEREREIARDEQNLKERASKAVWILTVADDLMVEALRPVKDGIATVPTSRRDIIDCIDLSSYAPYRI